MDLVHSQIVERVRQNIDRMEGAGELFAALADDTRLKVMYALSQAELCVCDVAAVTGVSKAVASYHLRLLYRLGLARYRKDGRLVFYRLADHDAEPVVSAALAFVEKRGRASAPAEGEPTVPAEPAAAEHLLDSDAA